MEITTHCPFCNTAPYSESLYGEKMLRLVETANWLYVECTECGARGPRTVNVGGIKACNKSLAIWCWNERSVTCHK
jgi:heterodisulfide reductase subunit C